MARASGGLLGRLQREHMALQEPYGPNTAQVRTFISAVTDLTPAEWKKVAAFRRLITSVTKDSDDDPADSIRSFQAAIRNPDGHVPGPMSKAGHALFESLGKRSSDQQVAAWQAVSALVSRHRLPALKFAAHYAPFAAAIPFGGPRMDVTTQRFLAAVEGLSTAQCEALTRRWRVDHDDSRALLRASAGSKFKATEEAVALVALRIIPAHVSGDAGWAAVKTAVHGGRVLACRAALGKGHLVSLWAPLEAAIPLASLDKATRGERLRTRLSASGAVAKSARIPKPAAAPPRAAAEPPEVGPPALYGPNSTEVAAFVAGVQELAPIQWLRILDRRQLVASVTRESAEPAGIVRSILAAIKGTEGMDVAVRCKAFAAVERAGFAVEGKARLAPEQAAQYYAPLADVLPLDEVDAGSFAKRLGDLTADDWTRVAGAVASVNEKVVAPMVAAGSALTEFIAGRSDEEAVATWHAVSALVRRRQLTPVKFAASYAPFASAIPVTKPKDLSLPAQRYVTAVGRLSANQCSLLAQPWQLEAGVSNALSKAVADGSARLTEEAAALAAVVTIPMRVSGNAGWAAVKTAAFGGQVMGSVSRLSPEHLEALWKPLQAAIPLTSLEAEPRSRR